MEEHNKDITSTDTEYREETVLSEELPKEGAGEPHRHHSHHSNHSHHHRHHHRHHRHHRHGSSSKRKTKKAVSFLKKHRSLLVNILSCTVSVVLLFILAANTTFQAPSQTDSSHFEYTQSTVKIETSVYPQKISLVSEAVAQYLQGDVYENATQAYKAFSGYEGGLNVGQPFTFTYQVSGIPAGVNIASIQLEISENDAYSDAWVYTLNADAASTDIYNLKTGLLYYYRVTLALSDGSEVGTVGSFETARSPRILKIDGAANVRDIGGWKTTDGGEIRQGLLFRGSELDGAVQSDYTISDQGLQQMIGKLGIRFDMDLRTSADNEKGTHALGNNVIHKYYGVGMYSEMLENTNELKEVFSDLANPANYPIYMHCTHGRDRTGSVCYLLEALLGVSDEDLQKEYELSAFTDSYVNTEAFTAFTDKIQTFKGDTTQQKVEAYLLSIDITKEQINSIRDIFLGD